MSFEMNELIIRSYQSGDHNSIARNLQSAEMYYEEWDGEAVYENLSRFDPESVQVCVNAQGEIIGSFLFLYSPWAASIYRLNVRVDCRGKGIGRLLFEKADQLAKERNCPQLLFAEAENQHLEDFYEKNGFEHNSHLYKGFYKDRLL